jgi:hypothetical protein
MTFGKASPRGRVSPAIFALVFPLCGFLGTGSGCGGDNDPRPRTWSYISTAILEPSCATANCHSALAQRASVDLSTRTTGYHSLVDRKFVISDAADPGVPADDRVARSPVIHLMRAEGNLRMPPDMPLPESDIQLIENWIRAGAAND